MKNRSVPLEKILTSYRFLIGIVVSVLIFALVRGCFSKPDSAPKKSNRSSKPPVQDGLERIFSGHHIQLHVLRTQQAQLDETLQKMNHQLTELPSQWEEKFKKSQDFFNGQLHSIQKRLSQQSVGTQAPEKIVTRSLPKHVFAPPKTVTLTDRRTVQNYIPSGSHVQAVLIGSVSAGAGVSAQTDLKPMILRTLGPIHLPNRHTRPFGGCTVIAKAYGDLSSERIYGRLATLSCLRADHTVFEAFVKGSVFGPDGAYGIYGRMRRLGSEQLRQATTFGILSSLSQVLSNKGRALVSWPDSEKTTQPHSNPLLFGPALTQGAGHALNQLAQYYIKRAELYQPVIQVAAGITVDLVFTEGFSTQATPQVNDPTQARIPYFSKEIE